ncbi:16542_t:CDS:1, partial [Entrophospora sp. SA101]
YGDDCHEQPIVKIINNIPTPVSKDIQDNWTVVDRKKSVDSTSTNNNKLIDVLEITWLIIIYN